MYGIEWRCAFDNSYDFATVLQSVNSGIGPRTVDTNRRNSVFRSHSNLVRLLRLDYPAAARHPSTGGATMKTLFL